MNQQEKCTIWSPPILVSNTSNLPTEIIQPKAQQPKRNKKIILGPNHTVTRKRKQIGSKLSTTIHPELFVPVPCPQ